MESLVVRMYRLDGEDQNLIAGVVEHFEENWESTFSSLEELITILCRRKPIGRTDVGKTVKKGTSDSGPD